MTEHGGPEVVVVTGELLYDRSRVQVTMVQLSGVNTTPFTRFRSKLSQHPMPSPPVCQPEIPAEGLSCGAES